MIRFGIVGTGIMGTLYARLISEHPKTELAAVAGITREHVDSLAKHFGVPGYLNHQDMFSRERLDAVYIATPDFAHTQIVLHAVAADLHILLEKPMTMRAAEAEAIVETLSKKPRLKGMLRYGNRWSPPFVAAKQRVESGELGQILSVNVRLNDTIYVPTQMLSWAHQTTPAWFLMTHALDVISWLTGQKATRISANGVRSHLLEMGVDTYDVIQALIRYENGTTGLFESGWVLPLSMPSTVDSKYEIIGSRSTLVIDQLHQTVTHASGSYKFPSTLMTEIDGKLEGYLVYTLSAFVQAIENDLPSPVPFETGLENVRILEAIHQSVEENRPVDVA